MNNDIPCKITWSTLLTVCVVFFAASAPAQAVPKHEQPVGHPRLVPAAIPVAVPVTIPMVVPAPVPAPARATDASLRLVLDPADLRVSSALTRFATEQGWHLAWESDRDFLIEHAATFKGSFLEILAAVALALQNTDAPIRIKTYAANRVVRVIQATQ